MAGLGDDTVVGSSGGSLGCRATLSCPSSVDWFSGCFSVLSSGSVSDDFKDVWSLGSDPLNPSIALEEEGDVGMLALE